MKLYSRFGTESGHENDDLHLFVIENIVCGGMNPKFTTATSAPQKYKIKNTKDRRMDKASSIRDIGIDADRD